MTAPELNLVLAPQEYFKEKVSEAATNQNVEIEPDIEFYLVNLLCEFIAPSKLETITGDMDAIETPLALMLKKALEAPPSQKVRIFKFLGDTSLYISGFFQDYFNRKSFDIDYYISLGANAYDSVSAIMRDQHSDDHFTGMYQDLSCKFGNLVEIVAEVADTPGTSKPMDILATYERWTHSNSDRLRRLLEKAGISPIHTDIRKKQ